MSAFYKLTPEERAEWRANPATKAAMATLREVRSKTLESVLAVCRSGGTDPALRFNSGVMSGLDSAIDVLENEK